jgi:hypothetical protein
MTTQIDFLDPRVHADFATFIGRARQASADGAVRIQRFGPMLVLTVAVLPPAGMMGEGAVLGLRIMPVEGGEAIDTTVPIAAVSDRLARRVSTGTVFPMPPTTLSPAWSGISPPRGGWEPVGELECAELDQVALAGIEEIARAVPEPLGNLAVQAVRREVWARSTDTVPPIPSGMAFAAHVLGFTHPGERASVTMHGVWTRLSLTRGHVLTRS